MVWLAWKASRAATIFFCFFSSLVASFFLFQLRQFLGVLLRQRPFRNRDNAEILAPMAASADGFGHLIDVVGDFRNEDDVGAAGHARAQPQPAGVVAHDFDHDDPVVTVGRGMEAVDGVGGDGQGGVEAKGDVGHGHVVVDGLGQGEHVHPGLGQTVGVFLGAAAADADQGFQVVAMVVVEHHFGHVLDLGAHRHFMGFVAAGAEDGAAQGEDAGKNLALQVHGAVFHQTAEAVAKADGLHVVGVQGAFADGPDGRVQAGAVAARRQHANAFSHVFSCEWLKCLS